jgi:D-inositol-3-phosphate glycosyltransferase
MGMEEQKRLVFFITSTGWGGLEMNVLKQARHLRAMGWDLTLITTPESTIIQHCGNVFTDIFTLPRVRKYFDFKAAATVAAYLQSHDFTLLMVFDNRDLDVIALAKQLWCRHLRVVYHQQMKIGVNKRDILHSWRYRQIDVWITPLAYLRDEIAQKTRYDIAKVKVIPMGTEVERFAEKIPQKREARSKLDLPQDVLLFGIIGRLAIKKGQDFVIRAFHDLSKTEARLHLLVFGSASVNDPADQAYAEGLHAYVARHKLGQQIHFVPYRQDVELFYAAVDVAVVASHGETYGMVTVEAMAAGLPVIGAAAAATPDLLGDGAYGLLYELHDEASFIAAARQLINAPERRRELGLKAREKARLSYSVTTEMQAIAEVLTGQLKEK